MPSILLYFGAYCKRINKENIRFYRVNMLPSKNSQKSHTFQYYATLRSKKISINIIDLKVE